MVKAASKSIAIFSELSISGTGSPWLATSMMFGWMASLGLPLLAGFVAELMLMVAYWYAYGWWILLPGLVLAITAAYYLWSMQRTIFEGGEATQPPESLHGEPVQQRSFRVLKSTSEYRNLLDGGC